MRLWAVLIGLIGGCGRIGFGATGTAGGDAAHDGTADVAIDGPPLRPNDLPPYGTPTKVPLSLATFDDDCPTLTGDMLEIFFHSNRGGASDEIFTATRALVTDAWGPATLVTALNTVSNDDAPHVSLDGLSMYWTSGLGGNFNIYTSTRPDRMSAWAAPVAVAQLNTPGSDVSASTNATNTIVITSSSTASNGDDLFESRRATASDQWGTPVPLTEIDSVGNEDSPDLDGSGLLLFFDLDNPTHDIYWTQRASLSDPWQTPIPVTEVNTSNMQEGAPWVSPDLRTIYFARQDLTGQTDLFVAVRP